jgi:hypothetical protein
MQDLERRGRAAARRVAQLRERLRAAQDERDGVAAELVAAGRSLSQAGRIVGGLCKERTRRAILAWRTRQQASRRTAGDAT